MSVLINTIVREATGRPRMKSLRRNPESIPAILHNVAQGSILLVITEYRVFEKGLRDSQDDFYQIALAGKNYPVRLKEVQRHPISRKILHVDFVACIDGS